ncbi:tripartite motif-containing protein 2-like [Haliotis asinina]|uniref:tripartite motif-containing protein 2-like n=1 Tax=Haliotis asinina TaxID=109174 RepID=UPI0035318F44
MAAGVDTTSYDQAVICSICLEEYINPKLLPCFHTFCLECLEQHAGRTTTSGHFPCPQCRNNVKIPAKGVQGFQTNFYITNVREMSRTNPSQAQQEVIPKSQNMCDICKKGLARFDCRTCHKYLCNGCKKNHKKPKSHRNHHVVLIREESAAAEVGEIQLCPKHHSRGEILIYYCLRCDVPICMSCKLTAHEGHKSEDLEDRVNMIKKELRECNFEAQRMCHKLEDLKDKGVKMEVRCQGKVDEVMEQISSDREAVLKLVTERSKCLEGKLNKRAKACFNTISAHLEKTDISQKQLDEVKNKITNTLEKGSFQEMQNSCKEVKKRLDGLKKDLPGPVEVCSDFVYEMSRSDRSRVTQIDALLGRINTCAADLDRGLMPRGTEVLATFRVPQGHLKARSLASSEAGVFLCYDPCLRSIDVLSTTGSMIDRHSIDFEVSSVAVSESGSVFLASASKKLISILMDDMYFLSPLARDLPICPSAITATEETIIAVGSSKESKAGIVKLRRHGGYLSWVFNDKMGTVFKKPADVALWSKTNQSMVIVTDSKAHRVVFISKQGSSYHITKIYSGEGMHQDAEQFCPYGVCVDKLGNIFVADMSSQAVIQLSWKGNLMDDHTLMFDQGFIPKCLASTPECNLIVGSTDGMVKVIKRASP